MTRRASASWCCIFRSTAWIFANSARTYLAEGCPIWDCQASGISSSFRKCRFWAAGNWTSSASKRWPWRKLEKAKLENCRVVLVRPRIAANLGAVARVMRNMGLDDFVLVQPEADPADPEARKLSTHGEEILRQARVASSLSDAVRDCTLIAATSARTGGLFRRQSMGPPDEIIPLLAEQLDHTPVALVFGPEATGLTNAEIASCHYLIHIPTDPGYPALNLAQAVAICLYELRRAWLKRCSRSRETSELKSHEFSYSTFEVQERMFSD